jgi:hypothetical protein
VARRPKIEPDSQPSLFGGEEVQTTGRPVAPAPDFISKSVQRRLKLSTSSTGRLPPSDISGFVPATSEETDQSIERSIVRARTLRQPFEHLPKIVKAILEARIAFEVMRLTQATLLLVGETHLRKITECFQEMEEDQRKDAAVLFDGIHWFIGRLRVVHVHGDPQMLMIAAASAVSFRG